MDNLTLAQKLLGKEKTTENKSQAVNPSSASIVYMIAVTSSSGGEVVLKDEVEATADWEEEDIIEVDEDGDFEEFELEDDSAVDDSVVDMTDGDGADIDEAGENAVLAYQADAVAAYAEETAAEEGEATEDDLAGEDAEITDEIDDGDATELPDDGEGEAEEDDLAGDDTSVDEIDDADYTLTDDNSDDESDDPIEGAEISDGYTVAECIGSIKAGDRVAVMIQDGKITVLGVVGSGDEAEALQRQAQETAEEAAAAADSATQKAEAAEGLAGQATQDADDAKVQAEAAKTAATNAQAVADTAKQEALEAAAKADDAKAKADLVETNLSAVTQEVNTVKADATKMRTELEAQIETVKTTMSATYAKKDDVSQVETTLRSEFQTSIAGIQSTFAQDYAKKTDVEDAIVTAKASLQTQITQNASTIALTAKSVEDIQVDITEQNGKITQAIQTANAAQSVADAAKTDATQAQTAANEAKTQATAANTAATQAQTEANEANTKANAAQTLADQAKTDLATAQAKLTELEGSTSANAEDIAQAQQAVQDAQAAVQTAQAAADKAKTDAQTAQSTADAAKTSASAANTAAASAQAKADEAKTAANTAQAAADEAKEDLKALESRVVTAETNISQNSEAIALRATKEEVSALESRVSSAEQKITADAIISTVSGTYVTKTDAANTYATQTTLTQTAQSLTAQITTAKTAADDAAKVATNYLEFSGTGLVVGDLTAETLGNNVLIDTDSVDIRNGEKVLASYQANTIYLGLDDPYQTTIDMCNGMATFSTYADDDEWNRMVVNSEYGMYFVTSGEIQHTAAYSPDYGQTEHFASVRVNATSPWEEETKDTKVIIAASITDITGTVEPGASNDYGSSSIIVYSNLIDIEATGMTGDGYPTLGAAIYLGGERNSIRCIGDEFYIGCHQIVDEETGLGHLFLTNYKETIVYTDLKVGGKGYNDGKGGVFINSDGYIQIQRNHASYHPYISFYLNENDTSTADGQIRVNQSTGHMQFLQADAYSFDENIFSSGGVYANGSIQSKNHVYSGGKGGLTDGKDGVMLTASGVIGLQRSGGNPYIGFYKEGSTSYDAFISYDYANDYLTFGNATRYTFDGPLYSTGAFFNGGIRIGNSDTASSLSSRSVSTIWKDGSSHNIVERASDGLTAAFGWVGSSSYATVTKIRGRTCQYQNSSGTTALSDERLKKSFETLDRWDAFFDALEPFAFKLKNGSSGRFHFGFKAQQFEHALLDNGLTAQDCAAFVRMVYQPDEDDPEENAVFEAAGIKAGDYYYGIIYTELIAMNVYQTQQLKAEMKELKAEIQRMKNAS